MTVWVYRQSDATTRALRAHGCGAYTAVNGLVRASRGTWRPKGRDATSSARARVDRSGVTDAEFAARGMTSDEVYASLVGVIASDLRMDLPVQQWSGIDVRDELLPKLIEVDGCAAVAVLYGVVQDAGKGVGSFRKGHWVLIDDPTDRDVRVADPLRRQLVRWPIDLLEDAMGRFGDNRAWGGKDRSWGDGRGEAVILWPWRKWRDGYGSVLAQRNTARTQRDVARAALAECQASGDAAAIAAARAQGIADAAAAAGAVR